jgi:hypothetical protein
VPEVLRKLVTRDVEKYRKLLQWARCFIKSASMRSTRKPALENMNGKGSEGDKHSDSENLAILFGDRQRQRSIECKRHAVHGQNAHCDAFA